LKPICIPRNVEGLGESHFSGCRAIGAITFKDELRVIQIDDSCF
jgi:hypothetical protein